MRNRPSDLLNSTEGQLEKQSQNPAPSDRRAFEDPEDGVRKVDAAAKTKNDFAKGTQRARTIVIGILFIQ
jgi:hypothetical protein